MAKLISFHIWNDYSRALIRCVRARYPKEKFSIVGKYKGKKHTRYYLKEKKNGV